MSRGAGEVCAAVVSPVIDRQVDQTRPGPRSAPAGRSHGFRGRHRGNDTDDPAGTA